MLMKGKPHSMVNRDWLQFIANEKGEIEVPEQYVPLLKLYGFSLIVSIIEKQEEKKETPIEEETITITVVEEKPLPITTKKVWKWRPKKSGNAKQKTAKR